MNKYFRTIVISILFALTLVFCWQIYWLRGLYQTMEDEVKKELTQYIELADQLELFDRIEKFEEEKKQRDYEKSIMISATPNKKGDFAFEKKEVLVNKNTLNSDTLSTKELTYEKGLSLFEHLAKNINQVMHEEIDSRIPINIFEVDSLIRNSLAKNNTKVQYYFTELWDTQENKMQSSSLRDSNNMHVPKEHTLTYYFGKDHRYCYKVYMEPLTRTVFIRMGGILATTLLIIIILTFAFWFLIRTVINQKTLEDMKDDFTNNMTHELKTPIAVAYSATDALLNFDLSNDENKRKKYLLICKDQLARLSNLVEQILSMSMEQRKSFKLKREKVQVNEIIDGLVELHKLKANKPVNFILDYETDKQTINADRTHLTNMISNLIDNAIKYSGDEIQITIKADRHEDLFELSVKDNGEGIPTDKQKHIFDKFYRVPRGNVHNVKGYGLGLFYVKVMAEIHGGKVSVKSAPGKGSTFTIQIPDKKKNV